MGTVTGGTVVVTTSGSLIQSELLCPTDPNGASAQAVSKIAAANTSAMRVVDRDNEFPFHVFRIVNDLPAPGRSQLSHRIRGRDILHYLSFRSWITSL
ncbi:MAG: hypothetical protein O6923_02645 [Actinobacteria bacterium]|nr:hypothetical protein [Actinomycetota bacterium]